MDFFSNELSLNNQFLSIEDFIHDALLEYSRIINVLKESNFPIYKNYNFYNSKISNNITLSEILTTKNHYRIRDEVRKFKIIISEIINAPYWEDYRIHLETDNYIFKENNITNTSIAEAYEKSSPIISFIPSDYNLDLICVSKNGTISKNLINFFNHKNLLLFLYKEEIINFYDFCKNFYKESNLNFDKINFLKSFNLITNKNDELEFQNSFNLFTAMNWAEIYNSDGLKFKEYHNQNYLNVDEKINYFRVTQKYRVLGYREKDVFYVIEFYLDHSLSE